MTNNPIICAIDTQDLAKAKTLVDQLSGHVGAFKFGLEFFTAHGAAGLEAAAGMAPVFLDLKFHDIPNTAAGAVRSAITNVNAFMMTIHTSGGLEMMRAAQAASIENSDILGKKRPLMIGVTVLTSTSQDELPAIGVAGTLTDQVKRLAELAQKAGLDGVVCSPHEIALLRENFGKDFKLVVPGIRPAGSASGDQKRIMTPKEALDLGADYLVIGRPITDADDPAMAAQTIIASL